MSSLRHPVRAPGDRSDAYAGDADATVTTVADLLRDARAAGLEALDAEVLVAHGLERDRAWLRAWPKRRLTAAERGVCEALLERRRGGEPLAYITGIREFWSLELHVNAHTLIPRSDTETLVEYALRHRRTLEEQAADRPPQVLDLGTGSGAIALALASELPGWQVMATDADKRALQTARDNASRLGLPVTFSAGDWWQACPPGARFDLVVSNPPYLGHDDPHLAAGDLRCEPLPALISGSDGLDAMRTIAAGSALHLRPGGWLLVEHGCDQGGAVRALLSDAGLTAVRTHRDLAGHERVTEGCRQPQADADSPTRPFHHP